MRPRPSHQFRLPFPTDQREEIPESVRHRCRELLRQLLIQILQAEHLGQEQDHEREDPSQPS